MFWNDPIKWIFLKRERSLLKHLPQPPLIRNGHLEFPAKCSDWGHSTVPSTRRSERDTIRDTYVSAKTILLLVTFSMVNFVLPFLPAILPTALARWSPLRGFTAKIIKASRPCVRNRRENGEVAPLTTTQVQNKGAYQRQSRTLQQAGFSSNIYHKLEHGGGGLLFPISTTRSSTEHNGGCYIGLV